jgi:(2R)-3-sulfolactate dehydrogenase (NADP+)
MYASAGEGSGRSTVKPRPNPTRARSIHVDAGYGFAFRRSSRRNELRTARARRRPPRSAIASLRRGGHPVERLAESGLGRADVRQQRGGDGAWVARQRLFGTNPVAFACPLPGRPPLVIDLSLSKVARGNVMTAKQRGEEIPEGWALDENGQPTTDPDAALRGTMVPMGDAKGTALR